MHKLETHFIPENVAPVGTGRIAVLRHEGTEPPAKEIGYIPLGTLNAGVSPTKRRGRFLALADVHLTYSTSYADFEGSLNFAKDPKNECDFVCIGGDLTSSGTESEMAKYAEIVQKVFPDNEKPVYAIAGNHEHYSTKSAGYLEANTGHPLYYSFTAWNDVFVMVGHYGGYHADHGGWRSDEFISAEELQWLYETLEENRNRRCFVFGHMFPNEHGVGNPNGLYTSAWKTTDGGIGEAVVNLLCHYKNSLLFHGHSHTRLELQELDPKANYAEVKPADGRSYKSIHIPSLSVPRDLKEDGSSLTNVFSESEGYVVDIYDDCIILNGRDFVDNESDGHWLPIATYKIDTPLHTVEAGTFADSTGLIRV